MILNHLLLGKVSFISYFHVFFHLILFLFQITQFFFLRASIQPIIQNRIGTDVFISRLERLRENPLFDRASPYLISEKIDSKGIPEVYFDRGFVEFFKAKYGKNWGV